VDDHAICKVGPSSISTCDCKLTKGMSSPAVEFDVADPQVVTDWWLEWCIYEDQVVNPFEVFGGRPLRFVHPFPGE
jgi:hypothetical protein